MLEKEFEKKRNLLDSANQVPVIIRIKYKNIVMLFLRNYIHLHVHLLKVYVIH